MMRDQYASDISDYLKFAFLRAIAQTDRHLGIAWYYLPGHDGRADGRHVEYKSEPAWRALDEGVYDLGWQSLASPSLSALPSGPLVPYSTEFR